MKDSEIIELYLQRSETAIEETGKKYGTYLSCVVYNILRDNNDTEEIVNDTYMGAWKTIPPTIPESLKFYLSRIARNLSFDRLDYKSAGKRQAILVELEETIPAAERGPEELWEAKEVGNVLNRFLGTLEKTVCAVFVGRYYYSYTVPELAKQYGMTRGQIKYLLKKTREDLKQYLEKEGVTL